MAFDSIVRKRLFTHDLYFQMKIQTDLYAEKLCIKHNIYVSDVIVLKAL